MEKRWKIRQEAKLAREKEVNNRKRGREKEDDSKDKAVSSSPPVLTTETTCEVNFDKEDVCERCKLPMRLVPQRALLICVACGGCNTYIDATTASIPYGDGVEVQSLYCYKRLNHFRLQLSQLQGAETAVVPQDVIDNVMAELRRANVAEIKQISIKMIRDILKKLKLRKCYDHIAQIHARITGIPPFRLTPDVEERLRLMFIALQKPFERHCPPGRRNFLSYQYILYKFFQLLGLDQLLVYMTLLKGKDKLLKQDAIFKKCCVDLNWSFIPSL